MRTLVTSYISVVLTRSLRSIGSFLLYSELPFIAIVLESCELGKEFRNIRCAIIFKQPSFYVADSLTALTMNPTTTHNDFPTLIPHLPPSASSRPPTRHPDFYFSDGNIILSADNILYNVHRCLSASFGHVP
jgi:hypothetical protein